jgi:hypothetical protein
MSTSPVKGIANSSFYAAVSVKNGFVRDKNKGYPRRFRLAQQSVEDKVKPEPNLNSARVIPAAPVLYGASLSTISQQLNGVKTSIMLHGADCFWSKRNRGEWLYAKSISELDAKIKKLFDTYGNGATAVTKGCSSCIKAGRLPYAWRHTN